jgi:hypothetical protein
LAKRSSRDANTKAQGGDVGWVTNGDSNIDGKAIAENWLFDRSRKVGDLSPALKIVNGVYDIYYISAIDAHRPISASDLSTLRSNALDTWIGLIKTEPQVHIGDIDSSKQLDPNNFPANLPAGAPSNQPGATS